MERKINIFFKKFGFIWSNQRKTKSNVDFSEGENVHFSGLVEVDVWIRSSPTSYKLTFLYSY